jgi:hypothetical protein
LRGHGNKLDPFDFDTKRFGDVSTGLGKSVGKEKQLEKPTNEYQGQKKHLGALSMLKSN